MAKPFRGSDQFEEIEEGTDSRKHSRGVKGLFKRSTKPYYKQSQKNLLDDAFHLLRTNLNMRSLDHPLRSIMVTSSGPSEGKTSIAARLAIQYTTTHQKVLVINADTRAPALERYLGITRKAGLTDLNLKLFGETLTKGSVLNYGFLDLVTLIYLQGKSGTLVLKNYSGYTAKLFFERGILCDIQTPEKYLKNNLISSLKVLQKVPESELNSFIERSEAAGMPFPVMLMEFGFCSEKEIKNLLHFEMMGLFSELKDKDFVDFEFITKSHPGYERIASVLGDEMMPASENLKPIDFINSQLNEYIVPTNHKNLFCLPAGEFKVRLSEVFTPARLSKLLIVLFKQYDMIIFDSPPLSVGAEATVLGSVTDGTLMVVRSNAIHRQKIQKAIAQLKQAHARILGVVLNGIPQKGRYGYYYRYYNSYDTRAEV